MLDCLVGSALIMERWEENCWVKADLLRVTERANFANLLNPLEASSSIGCFKAVISLNVNKNKTTTFRSFLIGAMWRSSQSGEPVQCKHENKN